ncbi:hypothetical protein BT69DRAFT_154572 [Atractiella rhizophila]|nr:hypothetical protein BT69DRAFT_154572 [Atractiella rhizophila]
MAHLPSDIFNFKTPVEQSPTSSKLLNYGGGTQNSKNSFVLIPTGEDIQFTWSTSYLSRISKEFSVTVPIPDNATSDHLHSLVTTCFLDKDIDLVKYNYRYYRITASNGLERTYKNVNLAVPERPDVEKFKWAYKTSKVLIRLGRTPKRFRKYHLDKGSKMKQDRNDNVVAQQLKCPSCAQLFNEGEFSHHVKRCVCLVAIKR